MALNWPDIEAIKRLVDVTDDEFTDDIDSLLVASIDRVKLDCGLVLEDGTADPDALPVNTGQVEAAKRAFVLMRPGGNEGAEPLSKDGRYNAHIFGTRTRKGFA